MSEFKYRLNDLVMSTSKQLEINKIEEILAEDYGIHRQTFFNHRRITKDSNSQISEEALFKYAHFFEVQPEELLASGYLFQDKRTISELEPSGVAKRVVRSFKLKQPGKRSRASK